MADEVKPTDSIKEIVLDGYTFTADTDLLDDVEAFEIIDRIENKGQTAAIVPLLEYLIGPEEYRKMKEYYSKKDAEEHKEKPGYKGKFRVTQLTKVYQAIVEKFDPKG